MSEDTSKTIDEYSKSSSEVRNISKTNSIIVKSPKNEVKRNLNERQVLFVALGGTIGTGLFIGISIPIQNAGPAGCLIAYIVVGSIIYSVIQSLGEMVTFIPVTSSFTVFSQRFLSPAFGAANGYMYWFSWAMTFAVELSVVGRVIEYWTTKVPLYVWMIMFWLILTISNLFSVKIYGEIEFWISSIKIIAIIGFIIFCLCIICGAAQDDGPIGFRYWNNPGAWGPGIISSNTDFARFLGFVSSLISAAFTYQGTELIGIIAGETKNPRKVVPKAIKKIIFRILVFYILSLFFIGMLVPYNDPKLTSSETYVASSPFIIAIDNSGVKVLPDIFNAVILTTIISAGNSNIYIGSRILYGLSKNKMAPKWFSITNKSGVPYISVLFTSLFGSFAFLELSKDGKNVFHWLLNIVGTAGFFAWLLISCSHIRFMHALRYRGISRDDLQYKALFMPYLAYYATFSIILIVLIQGFTSFVPKFDVAEFFASYISLFIFIIIWTGFELWTKCRLFWKVEDIDIDTDRREIDETVWLDEPPKTILQKTLNIIM